MSAAPADPGAVQPAAQGEGGSGEESLLIKEGLYDVSSVPDHLHDSLAPILKDIEGRISPKLMEAAEQRKQLEAFTQLGITEPEQLQELVGFYMALQDPELRRQWWDETGESEGWFDDGEGGETPDAEANGGLTPEQVQEIVNQALSPIANTLAQQQDQQAMASSVQEIQSSLTKLHEEHGDFDDDTICEIAGGPSYANLSIPEALSKAHQRYQQIRGDGERGLIENKLGQNGGGLPSGQPAAKQEAPKSYDDARPFAKARLDADLAR